MLSDGGMCEKSSRENDHVIWHIVGVHVGEMACLRMTNQTMSVSGCVGMYEKICECPCECMEINCGLCE